MLKIRTSLPVAMAGTVMLFIAQGSFAQEIHGITDTYYDSQRNVVVVSAQTWADYSTYYYYDLHLYTSLSANGQIVHWASADASEPTGAVIDFEVAAQPATEYTAESGHSADVSYYVYQLDPYCSSDCNYFGDQYGYSLITRSPSDPVWDIWVWLPPIVTVALVTDVIALGPTQKKVTTPTADNAPYRIRTKAFIPVGYLDGPPEDICFETPLKPHGVIYRGDHRSYSLDSYNFRTMTEVFASPVSGNVVVLDPPAHRTGETRQYALPVDINSDGSIKYTAEDGIADDCVKYNKSGWAGTGNMHFDWTVPEPNVVGVSIWGAAGNPLVYSPTIDWSYGIRVDRKNPSDPMYTIAYSHDCYPAHEAWIKTQQMHGFTPNDHSITHIGACLSGILPQITGDPRTDHIY